MEQIQYTFCERYVSALYRFNSDLCECEFNLPGE